MSVEKRMKAMNISSVFLKNRNLIRWNSEGDFILPRYVDNAKINLNSLLRTLIYANEGTDSEIEASIDIIKPT